jgi:hypothetical protein
MAVMSRCLIVRAELNVIMDVIEYWAYSEMFDKLDEGYLIPEYTLTVKETMQGGLCYVDVIAERV